MNQNQDLAAPAVDPLFVHLMQQHRKGDCLADMSAALREVNKVVQLTGKPASVTLKIKVAPLGSVKGAVTVADDIKTSLPKQDKGASMFYANGDGTLLRDDPNQQHLDLRTVNGGAQDGAIEIRKLTDTTTV
jgi:hypothetical protein